MAYYKVRTYIAADWDGDRDLVNQLYLWNDNDGFALHFSDAHAITQARDTSLPCSIKRSLDTRMKASKKFVLIVGSNTKYVRKGSCQYCDNYSSDYWSCKRGYHVDYRSFVEYEVDKAVRNNLQIVVLYNSTTVDKSKCPELLRNIGLHIPAKYRDIYGDNRWNYQQIRAAIN